MCCVTADKIRILSNNNNEIITLVSIKMVPKSHQGIPLLSYLSTLISGVAAQELSRHKQTDRKTFYKIVEWLRYITSLGQLLIREAGNKREWRKYMKSRERQGGWGVR